MAMRKIGIASAVVLLWALSAGGARAGLYCMSEPAEWPSPIPPLDIVRELRALPVTANVPASPNSASNAPGVPGVNSPTEWKARYSQNMALLEEQAKRGGLSDLDRVNLSFYYIRFQKYEQAIAILKPLERKKDFFALANLATAEFLSGDLVRAAAHQEEALQAMPEVVAGWGREQLYALRRAETLFLALLNHRKTLSLPGRPPSTVVELDPLFPGVRYETRSGDFQAGAIRPEYAAALPPDALTLVLQLVIWLPFDNELYWQVGELLNAYGNYLQAYTVIDDLVYVRKVESPSLRKHRMILRDARSAWSEITKVWKQNDATVPVQLFSVTLARGMPGVPVGGDICREMGWSAALTAVQNPQNPQQLPDEPSNSARSYPPIKSGGLEWKQILVAFAAGAVVSWLLSHQFRQSRQRSG
jgi:hypothetical protein